MNGWCNPFKQRRRGKLDNEIPFWEKQLVTLSSDEWEALCDGCGLCCLNKIEDIGTGRVYTTRVACDLLNLETCQCTNYVNRKKFVPDCIKLTYRMVATIDWLPETCAYARRYRDKPLPEWHYLLTNDRNTVHEYIDVSKHHLIHEKDAKKQLHYYMIDGDFIREP